MQCDKPTKYHPSKVFSRFQNLVLMTYFSNRPEQSITSTSLLANRQGRASDLRAKQASAPQAINSDSFLQQFQMKSLTQQQIKQEELKLLEMSGFSLAQYAANTNSSSFFKDLPTNTKIQELERLRTTHLKKFGLSSNANLKAFAFTLLTSVYANPVKQDVLSIIKSCLYSPDTDLTFIRHSPLPSLGNQQMKKLIVEFFFTLTYANYDDKIQDKLRKYPIAMDILVIFLRCLLFKLQVKNAEDCLFKLPTKEIYEILINVLDVNCKLANSIYLFYDDHIFLFENANNQVITGNYAEYEGQRNNMNQLKKTLKLSELEEEIEEDTENDRSEQPSMSSHNRSLELRGVVSESIVFEPQAPTPFFNLDSDNNSSFQSNQGQPNDQELQIKRQKDSFMKGSKEMSLLKLMDRSIHFQQNAGGLGNIARSKIIENQMKQSIEEKEALAMITDSPITLDSPHTLFSDGNFGSINDLQIKQEIKVMKKSKSESASRMSKNIEDNNEQTGSPNMKKKERIYLEKSKESKKTCECTQKKQKAIKLCSNLYEINMRYVPHEPVQPKKRYIYNPALDFSQNQVYINSKGINCEIEAPAANHNASLQYIRYKERKESIKQNLDTSIHSCTVFQKNFKDSETQSKRQFSPISYTGGERSSSPFGETRSIASPKVTFTYQNKLKYSTQFSNQKRKNI